MTTHITIFYPNQNLIDINKRYMKVENIEIFFSNIEFFSLQSKKT